MFNKMWQRWTKPATGITTFTDTTTERLRAIERDYEVALRRLDRDRGVWTTLERRTDYASHLERTRLAPVIAKLESEVAQMSRTIAETKAAIKANDALVAQYTQAVANTDEWFRPVFDCLPSDAALERAYCESHHLNRLANELLQRTGDRQFHRSAIDPYSALRDAFTNRMRLLERLRLTRTPDASVDKKAAS